jgi:hypothetical protein
MSLPAAPLLVRALTLILAAVLLGAGATLGYVAIIAFRRSEGVFMPAGYVALACLGGGAFLLRMALRG